MANHIPILAIPIALLILSYGTLRELEEVKKVALGMMLVCGLLIWPVYLSGEPSEDTVENLPQVSKSLIESHEDSGKIALILTELLAVASLAGLALSRRGPMPRAALVAVMALAVASSLALAWTGYQGGQVRHAEVRSDFVPPADRD